MKNLHQLAEEYAQKNFPISEASTFNAIKHDIAFHSFCDGFNEAMRILMQIGGQLELDKRVSPFNFISIENKQEV